MRDRTGMMSVVILLALGLPMAADAAPLGKLFFTPQEREALATPPKPIQAQTSIPAPTAARPTGTPMDSGGATKTKAVATKPAPGSKQPERITGFVLRSSGNNTVWVNHAPRYGASIPRKLAEKASANELR
jgi:hypothetical protein